MGSMCALLPQGDAELELFLCFLKNCYKLEVIYFHRSSPDCLTCGEVRPDLFQPKQE